MGHAMRDVNKEEQLAEKWISAKMLAHVLEVRRRREAVYSSNYVAGCGARKSVFP